MSIEILPSLSAKLVSAVQSLETIVLRTNEGAEFRVEIGNSVLNGSLVATVTLMDPHTHIGMREGETIKQVSTAAQELIAAAIASGITDPSHSGQSAVPKPHISGTPKIPA